MKHDNEISIPGIIDATTFISEGFDGWRAGFTIGVQTFYLQPVSVTRGDEGDTKEKALWYQKNLETALSNLVALSKAINNIHP